MYKAHPDFKPQLQSNNCVHCNEDVTVPVIA